MIDKITPDTKVSEICEVLEFIQGDELFPVTLWMHKDMTGNIVDSEDELICNIKNLGKYLKSIKKTDERDYDKILEDPAAVKKILSNLPIHDLVAEMYERIEKNKIQEATK